jgi:hypothetical protein
MEEEIARRFRRGEPRESFETLTDFEEHIIYFFSRLKDIVSKENMIYKWKSVPHTLDMLHQATEIANVDIVFIYTDGYWYIDHFSCEEDILNLPVVAKIFSKMYRFQEGHGENPKARLKHDREICQIGRSRDDST